MDNFGPTVDLCPECVVGTFTRKFAKFTTESQVQVITALLQLLHTDVSGPFPLVNDTSKKQTAVALSTNEAEYLALSDSVKELLTIILVISLKFDELTTIYEDNESTS